MNNRTLFSCAAILCFISIVGASDVIAFYSGSSLYSGNKTNFSTTIDDVKASGFTDVILWSIHVRPNGDLVFNDNVIVQNFTYVGDADWPRYIAQLMEAPTTIQRIYFSVGAADNLDFTNVHDLIRAEGTGKGSTIYRSFDVLKKTFPDIYGVDFDNEEQFDKNSMVSFAFMLDELGYKISLCPYDNQSIWIDYAQTIFAERKELIVQFNVQCYDGGDDNHLNQWQNTLIRAGLDSIPLYLGYETKGNDEGAIETIYSTWGLQNCRGGFLFFYDTIQISGQPASYYASAMLHGLQSTRH